MIPRWSLVMPLKLSPRGKGAKMRQFYGTSLETPFMLGTRNTRRQQFRRCFSDRGVGGHGFGQARICRRACWYRILSMIRDLDVHVLPNTPGAIQRVRL